MLSGGPVRGVLFDLDDTLFPQAAWLDGAWDAVARAAAAREPGLDEARLAGSLRAIAAAGSDQGRIIDRALAEIGASGVDPAPLVAAFRAHRPERLHPYPAVPAGLAALRRRHRLGLVTDGDPGIQRGKLAALGLVGHFDAIVYSDELGRERRKPDPLPFLTALEELGLPAAEVVMVGDRPGKDVAGARAVGMRVVRVRTGEYAHLPDDPAPTASVADVRAAFALLGAPV